MLRAAESLSLRVARSVRTEVDAREPYENVFQGLPRATRGLKAKKCAHGARGDAGQMSRMAHRPMPARAFSVQNPSLLSKKRTFQRCMERDVWRIDCARFENFGRNGDAIDPCADLDVEPARALRFAHSGSVSLRDFFGEAMRRLTEAPAQAAASVTPRREFSRLCSARPGSCPACNPDASHNSDTGK
jgi:hypothetical protein